jgi:hypothetical protein
MKPILRTKFAAACLATSIAGAGVTLTQLQQVHGAPSRPAPTLVAEAPATPAAPRTAADQDARRYADRERTAEPQQAYQGGRYLVIGISTTAAIVLLVLLVLLL